MADRLPTERMSQNYGLMERHDAGHCGTIGALQRGIGEAGVASNTALPFVRRRIVTAVPSHRRPMHENRRTKLNKPALNPNRCAKVPRGSTTDTVRSGNVI